MTKPQESKLAKIAENRHYGLAEATQKSQLILDRLIASSDAIQSLNFTAIAATDLRLLFELIDEQFFDRAVDDFMREHRHPIQFRVSSRMTNSGGITTTRYPVNKKDPMEFEIAISSTLLFESFRDEKPIIVTGLLCGNRLQALKRIMEHEIIHLVEMLLWQDSSCAASRFQEIANRFFGHKQSTHQLITPADNAAARFNISTGDWVSFHFENTQMFGFVNRITKRATVLVPCANGTKYTDGKSYKKYYVPINQLEKATKRVRA